MELPFLLPRGGIFLPKMLRASMMAFDGLPRGFLATTSCSTLAIVASINRR